MRHRSRREMLAMLSGGPVALAGCSALTGSGEDPADGPSDEDPADGQSGDEHAVDRVDAWPHRRGPPTNTGLSATGGPTANASPTVTAQLRDGFVELNVFRGWHRSPVIGEDAIYAIAGEANPYQQSPTEWALYAYALSREDGSEIWRETLWASQEITDVDDTGRGICLGSNGLYATWNAWDDKTLTGVVARLSPSDGSEQWRQTIPYTTDGDRLPVVRDGRVHLYGRGQLIALDTEDGSELWRTPEPRRIRQPLPTVGDDCAVVHHETLEEEESYSLTAFETDDQSVRWTTDFQAFNPVPTIADGTVYVPEGSFGDQTTIDRAVRDPTARDRRKIHALSLSDGSERWSHTYDTDEIHQAPTVGGPRHVTVSDDHVYYALGFLRAEQLRISEETDTEAVRERLYRGPNVVALDRSDGSVVWRANVGSQAQIYRPMVAGPDSLYVPYRGVTADEQAQVYVIDRESGDVRGSFGPLGASESVNRPFAVADGRLYAHRNGAIQAWG